MFGGHVPNKSRSPGLWTVRRHSCCVSVLSPWGYSGTPRARHACAGLGRPSGAACPVAPWPCGPLSALCPGPRSREAAVPGDSGLSLGGTSLPERHSTRRRALGREEGRPPRCAVVSAAAASVCSFRSRAPGRQVGEPSKHPAEDARDRPQACSRPSLVCLRLSWG